MWMIQRCVHTSGRRIASAKDSTRSSSSASAEGDDGHFVRRQVLGKHITSEKLSGKCIKEQLKISIDHLLPSGDIATWGSLLRRCANAKALSEGKKVHAHISRLGYGGDTYLGNNLIQLYGKCGSLEEASRVFHEIRSPNIYSYNTMLSAYAQNGHLQKARSMFERMPQWDVVAWTAMEVAYAQNGQVGDAKFMFDRMPLQDVVAWNAMIAAYAQNGYVVEAIALFQAMDLEGMEPDKITFLSVMDALTSPDVLPQVREIHANIVQCNYESDVVLATALVDMYGKCGSPEDARNVFIEMPQKNVVSWTAMIAAYAQNGHLEDAKTVFRDMPDRNVVSWNAMITAYAHNGHLLEAKNMFEGMPFRDLNSWNVLISAYAQTEECKESLQFFRRMILEGVLPDKITYISVLDACACIPALAEGRLIHKSIVDTGFHFDVTIGNALVNLYGKCGNLEDAGAVFEHMPQRNSITWNAMLVTYSQNGHCKEALDLFKLMHLEGVPLDEITFVSIIFACSHGGLFHDGWELFLSIQGDFGMQPKRDHYMCMIDLLARAGQLREAEELVANMPYEADGVAWRTLLAACKIHGDFERGTSAGKQLVELDPVKASQYVLLSTMYCVAEDKKQLRVATPGEC